MGNYRLITLGEVMTKLKEENMKNEKGYTAIELLMVIAFAGVLVLAGFIIYALFHFIGKFW